MMMQAYRLSYLMQMNLFTPNPFICTTTIRGHVIVGRRAIHAAET